MISRGTDNIILNSFQQVFIEHQTWVFINRANVLLSYLMNLEQTEATLSMDLQIFILQYILLTCLFACKLKETLEHSLLKYWGDGRACELHGNLKHSWSNTEGTSETATAKIGRRRQDTAGLM